MATLEDLRTDLDPFESVEQLADTNDSLAAQLGVRPFLAAADPGCPEQKVAFPVVGILQGFDFDDAAIVRLPAVPSVVLVRARTTVSLQRDWIGCSVVIACEEGDPRRPIILGVIRATHGAEARESSIAICADGQRYVVTAEREIVLRCGAASLTLTRAGRVIIEGKYLVSRSSGYNKIKGAVVDIN